MRKYIIADTFETAQRIAALIEAGKLARIYTSREQADRSLARYPSNLASRYRVWVI